MTDPSLYDSASGPGAQPAGWEAGYADGWYADWAQVVAVFGQQAVLDVTVNPADDEGNCLDVETGDARPADAPGWVTRRRAAGVGTVWIYCNLSTWPACIAALWANSINPATVRWWIADYTGQPHFPTFAGIVASACQYAGGVTARFDTSCVQPGIFDAAPSPAVPPVTKPASPAPPKLSLKENEMALAYAGSIQYLIGFAGATLVAHALPAGTDVEAIAAAGTPNWGNQAALIAALPKA